MKIPWNSCKTWRKNYKNFRQIICKQQAKPRNIYMWWSRKFIKSKEKFVWCILQKLNIIELYLAEGYSILRFLWYLTVVRFLWNIVSAKRTQEKKIISDKKCLPSFLQTKLLLFDRRTCFQKYINVIPNACGHWKKKNPTKNKTIVVIICTAWRPKILWKDVYFCNS